MSYILSEELEKLRTKKAVDNKKKMLRVSYTGEVRFFITTGLSLC